MIRIKSCGRTVRQRLYSCSFLFAEAYRACCRYCTPFLSVLPPFYGLKLRKPQHTQRLLQLSAALAFPFLGPQSSGKVSFYIMFYHVLSHFIILNHIVSQSATWTVLEHSTVYFLSILCSYSRLLIRECTCFLRSMKSDSPLQSQSWLALPCPEFCGSGCTLGCFEHVPTCSNMFQHVPTA